MTLTALDFIIQHTEFDNPRAHRIFAGMHMARCTDMHDHTCDWRTLEGSQHIRALAVDHCQRAGHMVAVIDDGVVTTLMPNQRKDTEG